MDPKTVPSPRPCPLFMPGFIEPSSLLVSNTSLCPRDWVPLLRSHTPRTLFVQLSPQYLTTLARGDLHVSPSSLRRGSERIEWSDGTVETVPSNAARATDVCPVESSITAAIEELGGAVCPKLDNVCPLDAAWVNFDHSLKCATAEDVLTMLKSSERVLATIDCSKPAELALRKWINIDPRMQFRLFIKERRLIGVSHRGPHATVQFDDQQADEIVREVNSWFVIDIRPVFHFSNDYVVDVYLQRPNDIHLIDISMWKRTDALLFTWDELDGGEWMADTRRAQFRSVSDARLLPASTTYHGVPLELRGDHSSSSLINVAERLIRMQGQDVDED